jgi:hypothetical protein
MVRSNGMLVTAGAARECLKERSWVTSLAQQQPDSCHGRGTRAEMQAQLRIRPVFPSPDFSQLAVSDLENGGVVGRLVEFHLDQVHLHTEPSDVSFIQRRFIVAEQVNFIEGLSL